MSKLSLLFRVSLLSMILLNSPFVRLISNADDLPQIVMPTITPEDTISPSVEGTTPGHDAEMKELPKYYNNSQILVTFSEPIFNISDNTEGMISVKDERGNDAGFYAEYGAYPNDHTLQILSISENMKLSAGTYTVTVNGEYLKDKAGNTNGPYKFSFRITPAIPVVTPTAMPTPIDTIAPQVVNTTPSNGSEIKELPKYYNNSQILVTFSEPIFNTADNTSGMISVKDERGNDAGFYAEYGAYPNDHTLQILSLKESTKLSAGRYIVTINGAYLKDKEGNRNAPYTFSFRITPTIPIVTPIGTIAPQVVSTTPSNGSEITELPKYYNNSQILVTFSEPIFNTADNTEGMISVKDERGNDAGFYAEYGAYPNDHTLQILSLKESTKLSAGRYIVTINGAYLKDKAGNRNAPYTFSFRVVSTIPTVTPIVTQTPIIIQRFTDAPPNHWAYKAIEELSKRGIVSGVKENQFKPNDLVKRNQFAKIMCLALEVEIEEPSKGTFKDVDKKHWSYKYIESGKKYLTGYKLGNAYYFEGEETADREDMAVALVKALKLENQNVDTNELKTIFKDYDKISPELSKYVLIAYKNDLIKGYEDSTFRPNGKLTRAEACYLLYQIVNNNNYRKVTL